MSYSQELKSRGETALGEAKTNPGKALKTVLDEMPVRSSKIEGGKKNTAELEASKTEARKAVLTVLCAIDGPKLGAAIGGLSNDERDILMKFLNVGFTEVVNSKAPYDCNLLLKAHEEVCKLGNGPIIRTIHTRLEV